MIVATAGHVDHGKTSLVKQLTGVDTDRLEEEKRRGLSISLGFAYATLGNNAAVGFIDVPGHTRFINTMISGVSGIDLALLVVAADDGPMPQTLEHLEVLQLLGVEEFVLVITRIDRVDGARVAEVESEVQAMLGDSCPVFAVNNLDGTGISKLQTYLSDRAGSIRERSDSGHFRLCIDRSFLLKGTGLVVTGTALSGAVAVGDNLQLLPAGIPVRVRGIHAQDVKSSTGRAGQRCALDITGVDRQQLNRGDWLCAPEMTCVNDRIDARLKVLPSLPFALKHLLPVKMYIGARRLPAKLYLLEKDSQGNKVAARGEVLVQLILSGELVSCRGDRFVLRDDSESITLGGGMVLDPKARAITRGQPSRQPYLLAMEAPSAQLSLEQLAIGQQRLVNVTEFAQVWNLRSAEIDRILTRSPALNALKRFALERVDYALDSTKWAAAESALVDWLRSWHKRNPGSDGVQLKELRASLGSQLEPPLFLAAISALIKQARLSLANGIVSLADHRTTLSQTELNHWNAIEKALRDHGIRIPAVGEFQAQLTMNEKVLNSALRLAVKEGRLFQIGKRRFVLASILGELADAVNDLAREKPAFSVIDVKNHVGLGRNLVIELMEYFDSVRFTARKGDQRTVIDSTAPQRLFGKR